MQVDKAIAEFAELLSVGSEALDEIVRAKSRDDLQTFVREVKNIANRLREIAVEIRKVLDN